MALLLAAAAALAAPLHERPIEVAQPGPQRLDVDLALLAGSASDSLADLRLFDSAGREVSYLLVGPSSGEARWLGTRRFPIAPTKTTSGIELDAGSTQRVDALRIAGISSPFLKRVRVEGSGDRLRWTMLADATVFDLPHQRLSRTVVEFAPVEVRYVRLTWDDTSSARVGGGERVDLRVHGSRAAPLPLRASLAAQKRPSEPGKSRDRVRLPSVDLPIRAVEIPVQGDVLRDVTITEPRLESGEINPFVLGSGQLRQASRDGLVASDTRIPMSAPHSAELDVVVDNASNEPLEIDRVIVELAPQPWIYFEAPAAGSLVARFGDESLRRPRYDLEAARPLINRAGLSTATWGDVRDVRAAQSHTPGPLPLEGASVDRSKFAVERRIAPAGRGMSTLPLDADVLARSRELADVRLVDSHGRQVPFIVERRDEPLVINVNVGQRRNAGENVSAYSLRLPYPTLPRGSRLVLTTNAGVFERGVVLHETLPDSRDRRVLGRAFWRHADPDHAAPPVTFELPTRVSRSIELTINEGDNAPLPLASAKLLLPAHALRFHHPGSPLTLIYGNPEAAAPRYDLALLAPRLFREPAQQVFFANPVTPGQTDDGGVQRHFFWIAIAAVALLLMLLLARLLGGLTPSER
jgi:hypothetical protein